MRELEYNLTDDDEGLDVLRMDLGGGGGKGSCFSWGGLTTLGSLVMGVVGGDGVTGWRTLGGRIGRYPAVRGSCLVMDTMDTSGITMGVKSETFSSSS